MHRLTDERTRAYLYRVATAVVPLLIALGVITEDVASHALFATAAVLAIGEGTLASLNTSTRRKEVP